MAVLRSRGWPGSQDTSHPFRLGACRAVQSVWSLVMVVSGWSGSWFGFQVGFGFAVTVLVGLQGMG